VAIKSFGVSVSGSIFGGQLDAALIGGIVGIEGGVIQDDGGPDEPDARVFFVGVQGGFSIAGLAGFTIQFALSELGPLSVLIKVSVPVIIVPQIGLTLTDFTAGVE